MSKVFIFIVILTLYTFHLSAYSAHSEKLTNIFTTDHTPKSTITIDYSDWDKLLNLSVIDFGHSDRSSPPKRKETFSRISYTNYKRTRLEGNRVQFDRLSTKHKQYIVEIEKSIIDVTFQVALKDLSKNEQLAFWLNLHNIVIYNRIAEIYPITNLKPTLFGSKGKPSILDRPSITIGEHNISPSDIRKYVNSNWNDHRVMYGFYYGTIGGPNIRREAYTGDTVWQQLEENTIEFVNSLRGIQIWGDTLKVSYLYEINKSLFTDYTQDLLNHLYRYAKPELARQIGIFNSFKANIHDWHIADLYNGHLAKRGSGIVSTAIVGAHLMTNEELITANLIAGNHSKVPPHVAELIGRVLQKKQRQKRKPIVTIEEIKNKLKGKVTKNQTKEHI